MASPDPDPLFCLPEEEAALPEAFMEPSVNSQCTSCACQKDYTKDADRHRMRPWPVMAVGGQEGVDQEKTGSQAGYLGEETEQQCQAHPQFGDQLERGKNVPDGENDAES